VLGLLRHLLPFHLLHFLQRILDILHEARKRILLALTVQESRARVGEDELALCARQPRGEQQPLPRNV
jgi:hypothetical protein